MSQDTPKLRLNLVLLLPYYPGPSGHIQVHPNPTPVPTSSSNASFMILPADTAPSVRKWVISTVLTDIPPARSAMVHTGVKTRKECAYRNGTISQPVKHTAPAEGPQGRPPCALPLRGLSPSSCHVCLKGNHCGRSSVIQPQPFRSRHSQKASSCNFYDFQSI